MESKLRLEVIAVRSVSVPTTHETSGAFRSVAKLFPNDSSTQVIAVRARRVSLLHTFFNSCQNPSGSKGTPQQLEDAPIMKSLQHFIRSQQSLDVFAGRLFQSVVEWFARIAGP
jgi:hypothetical protein